MTLRSFANNNNFSNKPFFPHLKYWVNKKDTLGYERKFENRNKLFWIFFFLENNFLGISINFQDYFFLHSAFDWNPFDQSTRDICVLSVSYMFHLNKQHASAKINNTKYKMSYYNFI